MNTPSDMAAFLKVAEEVVNCYQAGREGKLVVECKRLTQPESASRVFLHGSLASPFKMTNQQLEDYAIYNHLHGYIRNPNKCLSTLKNPTKFLECSVLQVLKRTGYGTISMKFEHRRGKVSIIAEVMSSYLLRPVLP